MAKLPNTNPKPTVLEALVAFVWLALSGAIAVGFFHGLMQPRVAVRPELQGEMNLFGNSPIIGLVSGAVGIFLAATAIIAITVIIRFFRGVSRPL